jgi:diguanylate cyclase
MDQPRDFEAIDRLSAVGGRPGSAGAHPHLLWFDEVRPLLAATGLDPEPDNYEILYLHVSGADPGLSRAVADHLAAGTLDPHAILDLRRIHLGAIAQSEMLELVERTSSSATKLSAALERGQADLGRYEASIAAEDALLAADTLPADAAAVVDRIRRANASMLKANRQLLVAVEAALRENAQLLDRLGGAEQAARTDPLTGLMNRRGLTDTLAGAVAEAAEAGEPLAVALVDIDHFAQVNDQWGPAIGDEVLRCIGQHLASRAQAAAPGAFTGRYGGEEFLMGLPGVPLAEACAIVDRARAQLVRQVVRRASDGASLGRITYSAGVAVLHPGDAAETLLDRADQALYAAKRAGRDRVLPELPPARSH